MVGHQNLSGRVLNADRIPLASIIVDLRSMDSGRSSEQSTNSLGQFLFSDLTPGLYSISAKGSGGLARSVDLSVSADKTPTPLDIVLAVSASSQAKDAASGEMQFSDLPSFTVAGVTDWTAVGGHGSDATLRASESLAKQATQLKSIKNANTGSKDAATEEAEESELRAALDEAPRSFKANHELGEAYLKAGKYAEAKPLLQIAYEVEPTNYSNSYDLAVVLDATGELTRSQSIVLDLVRSHDTADLHRLTGDIDEKLGNPLAAVREDEQAVILDPSEQNYFSWGSELLLHRAIWQAIEVLRKGAGAHPESARILTALGAALFAGDLYQDAAARLCAASDMEPARAEQYIFMSEVETAAPNALPCVSTRLERFETEHPENATANYIYAMDVLKRSSQGKNQLETMKAFSLLEKAVLLDPKYVEAYLQLGILYSEKHDYEKAIGLFCKAIESDPRSGDAHYRLGVAYDKTGKRLDARKQFALHAQLEKEQADVVEKQRRELKQFLIVLQERKPSPAHP